jgi:hypothetical protein
MGLIVTGMHRSGTSAVARVVEALGLTPGGPAMGPAPDNPRGFFERPDVMDVNDAWLANLGGSWWAPPRTSPGIWRHLDQQRLAADREALGLFDPDRGPWYVKDPRISLLMPLWDRLALQPLPVVLAVRDPREVASSLLLRNGMPPRRALAVWFAYVRDALAASHDRPLLVLDYDALVSDPGPALNALGQFSVEYAAARTPLPTMDVLLALVEPGLRRNHAVGALGVAASEVEETLDAYLRVAKAHADTNVLPEPLELPAWAQDVLEEVREAYASEEAAREATTLIARLEQELRQVADPAQEVLAREEELRRAQAEHESLSLRLGELEDALRMERAAHDATRQEFDQTTRAFAELTERIQDREREAAVLEQELRRLRSMSDEAEARAGEAAARAESLAQAADLRLAEAHDALREARAEQRRAAEQATSLVEALAAKESDLAVAQARLVETRRDAEQSLSEGEEHRAALTRELEQAQQASLVLQSEVSRIRQDLERSQLFLTRLAAEKDAAVEETRARVAEVEGRLDSALRTLADRDRQLEDLRSQLSGAAAEAEDLAGQLSILRSARESDQVRVSRVESLAQARETAHVEALTRMTERLALTTGERQRLAQALDATRREMVNREAALQQAAVEREVLIGRAAAASARLDELIDSRSELLATVADLRQRLAVSEGAGQAQAEVTGALTEALATQRARAGSAERLLRESNDKIELLGVGLDEERKQSARLLSALVEALSAGQAIAEELNGIKASRIYRLRQRMSGRGSHPGTTQHFVTGGDAALIARVIAAGAFDPEWYATRYPDIAEQGVDPLYHYFTQGWREGREPCQDAPSNLGSAVGDAGDGSLAGHLMVLLGLPVSEASSLSVAEVGVNGEDAGPR